MLVAMTTASHPLGIFDGSADIGDTRRPGKAEYLPASGDYRVTGGGANMWGKQDAFHFVYKRVSGDVDITADVQLVGAGVEPHRKLALLIRQDLSAGSAYADVAVHGDGLTSLQFRPAAGAATEELRASNQTPTAVRLERRGNQVRIFTGERGTELAPTGPRTLELKDPIYIGLGVTAHNEDVLETAVFSNVRIAQPKPKEQQYKSKIAIYDLKTRSSQAVYTGYGVIEAPNWSRDGGFLLVNTEGELYRLSLGGARKLEKLMLGRGGYRCNNDHDFSADGKWIAFSAASPTSPKSQVYVADANGCNVRLVTEAAPSYFHGWSPDNKWLAFVAERGDGKYELYRVPATGGAEERLTFAGGYDDGPEYTPNGEWIYFNSNRGGRWNIWRMPPGGAGPNDAKAEQVTNDAPEDWFPHISPDGQNIVFLSFPHGTEGHNDKMPGMVLRLMRTPGNKPELPRIEVLEEFFGGQGTINVNSWSPDSSKFAYVIYEPVS
jgi:TolB protein